MRKNEAYLRNTATIERLAKDILAQCGHFRRNNETGDDRLRFWLIEGKALNLLRVTRQAVARYSRERGE